MEKSVKKRLLQNCNAIKKFSQYIKSDKVPYIIYADMEYIIKKMDVQTIQKILQQQK